MDKWTDISLKLYKWPTSILVSRETQIKTTMSQHFTPTRVARIRIEYEKLKPSYIAGGM